MTGSNAHRTASLIVSTTRAFLEARGVAIGHGELAELLESPAAEPCATPTVPTCHGQLLQTLESALGERRGQQVYTPTHVADWLARQVRGPSVLDPAAGTGRLLAARLRVAAAAGVEPGRAVAELLEGVELDPDAALVARASLVGLAVELGAKAPPRPNVQVADALRIELDPRASVIMNPPFANADELTRDLHERVGLRWPSFYRRQLDQSVVFMALGVECLEPGGTMAAIVPRYWMEATGAEAFRRWLVREAQVETLYDLGNAQVWPTVNVLTALVVLRRRPCTARHAVMARLDTPSQVHRLCEEDAAIVPPASYPVELSNVRGPWITRHPSIERRVAGIADCPATLEVFFSVGQGLKAGRNGVYVLTRERALELGLPEELMRPTVKTRDINAHRICGRGNVLLRVLADEDLDRWPSLRRYLEAHRQDLERRYQVRTGTAPWFALSLPQNLRLMNIVPKILTPLYARTNSFALDVVGYDVLTDVYAIAPRRALPVPIGAVVALLNSEPMSAFVRARAKLKRDGYMEFGARVLRSLPLPFDESGWRPVRDEVWRTGPAVLQLATASSAWEALDRACRRLTEGLDASVTDYVDAVAAALYQVELPG